MAFNHVTIPVVPSLVTQNVNYMIENVTLTALGVAVSRYVGDPATFSFVCGLTPPGDEDLQIYMILLTGLLSPADGSTWTGSIRSRDQIYVVLNYVSTATGFIYLTWTTTG